MQSGLNENWCGDSMERETYLQNVTDLSSCGEDALWKTIWENHLKDQLFHLVFIGWVLHCFCEGSVPNPSILKESTCIVPWMRFVRGVNLEGWHAGCRPWGVGIDGTHLKSTRKDSMRRRWYFPKKKENLFSNRRWTNQNLWRRSGSENIHLGTASTNSRRGSRWLSWRIRRVSSTTSRLISGCRWSDKWFLVHVRKLHIPPSRWTQSQALLAERRIIPYPTEIHWRLQSYSYEFGFWAGETNWWLLEKRWIKRFVRSMDRFHSIYSILVRNLQTDICGPEGD